MKTNPKLAYVLTLCLIVNFLSCNNDDDVDYSITVTETTLSIDENPSNGDVIGTVQATSNGALSYSIMSQTPIGAIDLNPNTGELTVADARFFNYEVYTNVVATISVSNSVETEIITAAITITDVAELSAQDTTLAIDENPNNGDVIGSIQVSSSNPIGYSIESQSPTGAIAIDTNSGEITVVDDTLFDFETNSTITATVALSSLGEMHTVTATININNINEIGDFAYGGVIFWMNATGNEGLVCTVSDQSTGIQWYNGMSIITNANGSSKGTGQANTAAIVNAQGDGAYAAKLCDDLSLNGYDDWFLPSYDELEEMHGNKLIIDNISVANSGVVIEATTYWSSTEDSLHAAEPYSFTNTAAQADFKSSTHRVRAVRAWTDF